jgi:hypothetical protein
MPPRPGAPPSLPSSSLADVLERILDKGLVIAGDIKVKLVDIELLTIQIRLLIASVDKAKELGMDWWLTNRDFTSRPALPPPPGELEQLRERVRHLEALVTAQRPADPA